ncbi:MAG: hypothetical protein AAF843_11935 [Bacteroidota bacterium]
MRAFLFITLATFCAPHLIAQDNCKAFLWAGDTAKYQACEYIQQAPRYFQLTRQHHAIRDSAIKIAPHYSYPYWAKSIAYLKTGDFLNWKKLIDKAVELDQEKYLGYRGWCRFQFFRDYDGAIQDIEQLERLFQGHDIGYSQNGDYHLNVAKALCFKMLGEKQKALNILESHLDEHEAIMPYDYLHLGVMYFENEQYDKALTALNRQSNENELADNQYYLAKVYEALGNDEQKIVNLEMAKTLYEQRRFMNDVYTHQVDKVYLGQIQEELGKLR